MGSSVTTFVLRRLTRAGGVFDATSKLTSCEVVERYYPKAHLLATSRADELYGLTFLPTGPKEDRPQSTRARLWNPAHENAFKNPERAKGLYLMRPLRMFASNGPLIAQPEVSSDLGIERWWWLRMELQGIGVRSCLGPSGMSTYVNMVISGHLH